MHRSPSSIPDQPCQKCPGPTAPMCHRRCSPSRPFRTRSPGLTASSCLGATATWRPSTRSARKSCPLDRRRRLLVPCPLGPPCLDKRACRPHTWSLAPAFPSRLPTLAPPTPTQPWALAPASCWIQSASRSPRPSVLRHTPSPTSSQGWSTPPASRSSPDSLRVSLASLSEWSSRGPSLRGQASWNWPTLRMTAGLCPTRRS
mmetsp:Transcript_23200/g.41842  ORF Transcript_23200/g.41842 Transcript_23200/m.41842 type:complete len:202 (+) Transcript_23200:1617-2222(+)